MVYRDEVDTDLPTRKITALSYSCTIFKQNSIENGNVSITMMRENIVSTHPQQSSEVSACMLTAEFPRAPREPSDGMVLVSRESFYGTEGNETVK